jgi:hypothetical protein
LIVRRKTHMDNDRKWNPMEDLEDTDALLHSGALPVDEDFSLEDILKEYGADTAPVFMKEAQRPIPVLEENEELEELEPPAEKEEAAAQSEPDPIWEETFLEEPPEEGVPASVQGKDAAGSAREESAPHQAKFSSQAPTQKSAHAQAGETAGRASAHEEPEIVPEMESGDDSEEEAAQEEPSNVVQLPVTPIVEDEEAEETPQEDTSPQEPEAQEAAGEEGTGEEEPMDASATAAFIGQQVSRAITQQEEENTEHNTTVNGLRQFFVEARRRTAEKKLGREQQLREKAAAAAMAEAAAAVK